MAATWAKNQVVPTIADQKKGGSKSKKDRQDNGIFLGSKI